MATSNRRGVGRLTDVDKHKGEPRRSVTFLSDTPYRTATEAAEVQNVRAAAAGSRASSVDEFYARRRVSTGFARSNNTRGRPRRA